MLTRRRLLASLAVLAGGGAIVESARLVRSRQSAPSPDEARVLTLAASLPEAARELGERCLAALPESPRTSRALAARLAAQLEAVGPSRGAPPAQLAAVVGRDFAAGRTVVVGGWVLARAEAEVYGLAALTAGW